MAPWKCSVHHRIPRNFVKSRDTEFRRVSRNSRQSRIEYGIYGGKKKHGKFRDGGIPRKPYFKIPLKSWELNCLNCLQIALRSSH